MPGDLIFFFFVNILHTFSINGWRWVWLQTSLFGGFQDKMVNRKEHYSVPREHLTLMNLHVHPAWFFCWYLWYLFTLTSSHNPNTVWSHLPSDLFRVYPGLWELCALPPFKITRQNSTSDLRPGFYLVNSTTTFCFRNTAMCHKCPWTHFIFGQTHTWVHRPTDSFRGLCDGQKHDNCVKDPLCWRACLNSIRSLSFSYAKETICWYLKILFVVTSARQRSLCSPTRQTILRNYPADVEPKLFNLH